MVSIKSLEHNYIEEAVYRPTYQGTHRIACIWPFKQMNKHTFIAENRLPLGKDSTPRETAQLGPHGRLSIIDEHVEIQFLRRALLSETATAVHLLD